MKPAADGIVETRGESTIAIPDTVRAVLAARVDALYAAIGAALPPR